MENHLKRYCPSCGTEAPRNDANYCYQCGYNFKEGIPAKPGKPDAGLPWHYTNRIIVLMLLFITPIGIVLMFLQPAPGYFANKLWLKLLITILFIIMMQMTYDAYVQMNDMLEQLDPFLQLQRGRGY